MKKMDETTVNDQKPEHIQALACQETQAAVGTSAKSTLTVHIDGFTCWQCVGDVMKRLQLVPGVVQVSVGPIDDGQAWVTVTSSPGASVTMLERALSRGGFHISAINKSQSRFADSDK